MAGKARSVPDSRALIKMGLGPDHDHLLNPESAMTSQPQALHAEPMLDQSPAVDPASEVRPSDVGPRTSDLDFKSSTDFRDMSQQ